MANFPKFTFGKPEEEKKELSMEHNNQPITSTGTFIIGDIKFEVKANDLVQIKELGRGAFGVVFEMKHVESGTIMAVKKIRATTEGSDRKYLMRDLNTIEKARGCPFIVTFYGVLLKDGDLWICMELMENSLDKVYKLAHHDLKVGIPESILRKIAIAVLKALNFLKKELAVMHRDVKPSNILINQAGQIKMCDFGIAGVTINSECHTRGIGCRAYMAPERVVPQTKGYDTRSDVWSVGCTMYELATGKAPYPPWQTVFDQLKSVVEGPPPRLDDTDLSKDFKEFTHLCLEKDVSKRPKYDVLLDLPTVSQWEAEETDVGAWYRSLLQSKPEQ